MIDWEEVIKAESTEELKEIKLWLFQENMRLRPEEVRTGTADTHRGSQRTAGHRAGYRRRQFYSGTAFIPGSQ